MPNALETSLLDHLASSSEVQGECLVWTGAVSPQGYGRVRHQGKAMQVHRIAWIERHGPIPPETPFVLHHCDNPPCWRDEHLFLGTQRINIADMIAKGRSVQGRHQSNRTHCPADHPYDEVNTYITPRGHRACRACKREYARAHPKQRSKHATR